MFKSIRNPLYNNQIFLSNLDQFSTDKNDNPQESVNLDNNNFNLNFTNSRFIRKNNSTTSSLPQNTQQDEEESHFLSHPDPMLQHDRSIVIKSSATEVDSLDGLGVYKKNPITNEWTYSKAYNSKDSQQLNSTDKYSDYSYSKRNGFTNDIQTYKETKCTVINRAPSYTNIYDPLYVYNSIEDTNVTSLKSSKNGNQFLKYGQIIEDF